MKTAYIFVKVGFLIPLFGFFMVFDAFSLTSKKSLSLPEGFVYLRTVDPSIQQSLGFATCDNCVGVKLDGYEANQVICTNALAQELKKVQRELKKINAHYSLRVLDAYRPVRATEHLKRWAADPKDIKTKVHFYPDIDKKDLPGKYIASGYSPHNRGSTVDVDIIHVDTKEPLDFGPVYFGDYAHIHYSKLTPLQKKNRLFLRKLMLKFTFKPYDREFWHFVLKNEPFPHTNFDFPIQDQDNEK